MVPFLALTSKKESLKDPGAIVKSNYCGCLSLLYSHSWKRSMNVAISVKAQDMVPCCISRSTESLGDFPQRRVKTRGELPSQKYILLLLWAQRFRQTCPWAWHSFSLLQGLLPLSFCRGDHRDLIPFPVLPEGDFPPSRLPAPVGGYPVDGIRTQHLCWSFTFLKASLPLYLSRGLFLR